MALSGHILWSFVILSGHMPCASSECSEVAGASIHRAAERNCPKRLGCAYNVALQATETVLFGPFWPPYTGKIYGRSVAHTPCRTVSEGVFSETPRHEKAGAVRPRPSSALLFEPRISAPWCQ